MCDYNINDNKQKIFRRAVIPKLSTQLNNILVHRTICNYTYQGHFNISITICIVSHTIHNSITQKI